jgi:D-beta-D-heptose 7-phosphate kinase/D-beta-D-heptose 1-phosphate adenosyltransferase
MSQKSVCASELSGLVDQFPQGHVLIVGDVMLDRFIWGSVTRISPEAPVPVVEVNRESVHLGGAANVVANVRSLGGHAALVGLVGQDRRADTLCALLSQHQVDDRGLIRSSTMETIQKTRIIAQHQQVVRVDRESKNPIDTEIVQALMNRVRHYDGGVPVVVISDYGKGVVTPELLSSFAGWRQPPLVCVDPKDRNFDSYRGAHILTPNQGEAERMSGVVIREEADLYRAAAVIFAKLACERLLITQGEKGMSLFYNEREADHIPTRAREVFDVSGAGDTVMATYSLCRSVGGTPLQSAQLANLAAGIAVGKLGTSVVTPQELKEALGVWGEAP